MAKKKSEAGAIRMLASTGSASIGLPVNDAVLNIVVAEDGTFDIDAETLASDPSAMSRLLEAGCTQITD